MTESSKEVWETRQALVKEYRDKYAKLRTEPEIDQQQLLDIQTQVLFDILDLLVSTSYEIAVMKDEIWRALMTVNNNVLRIPPPIPPDAYRDRAAFACGANALERRLEQIIRLLGGSSYNASDR